MAQTLDVQMLLDIAAHRALPGVTRDKALAVLQRRVAEVDAAEAIPALTALIPRVHSGVLWRALELLIALGGAPTLKTVVGRFWSPTT